MNFPPHSFYTLADGHRLHYVDNGAGDPIVMVHGNPTWSFFFRRLIEAFQDRYRVIALDHIGCGYSDKPSDAAYPYVLRRRVSDFADLLDHLDIRRRVTLVVHDWGGMIGLAWAVHHSERVARLIVLNTAAFRLPAGKRLPWQLRLCRIWPIGALLVRGLNLFCRGAVRYCSQKPLPRDIRQAYLAPYNSWNNRRAVLRFVEDIPLSAGDASFAEVCKVEEALPRLAGTPILLCWGKRDFVFDADFLAEWRRRFPHAEVHAFDNAGHYLLEDVPDEIIDRVNEFFDRYPLLPV
ncbi:MAG: alpha/beta hydrolase [Gemmatales bacterium]|nr:MAG: alpha/beta hydrolase [Gemmatales bacterium]